MHESSISTNLKSYSAARFRMNKDFRAKVLGLIDLGAYQYLESCYISKDLDEVALPHLA